ncbi:hypothetical protein B0H13DRAFT_2057946, partial [Mycena leptocephala]
MSSESKCRESFERSQRSAAVHAAPQLRLCFLPFALFLKTASLSVVGLWKHDLCRQLCQIASVRTVTKTRAEKRRVILIDLAIGLGIPLLCHQILLPLLLPIPPPLPRIRACQPRPKEVPPPHGPRRHRPRLTIPLPTFVLYSNVAITGLP